MQFAMLPGYACFMRLFAEWIVFCLAVCLDGTLPCRFLGVGSPHIIANEHVYVENGNRGLA